MTSFRANKGRQAQWALLWGFFFFAALQMAWTVPALGWRPEWRDPEHGYRLVALRRCLESEQDRPLVVVLGSSRTEWGFRPASLPACATGLDRPPLVFNYGLTGAGPLGELLCLRRLLHEGIKPQMVLVEVFPPWLGVPATLPGDAIRFAPARLSWPDLRVVCAYQPAPLSMMSEWLETWLVPLYGQRVAVRSLCLRRRQFGNQQSDYDCWHWGGARNLMDANGWVPYPLTEIAAADRRRRVDRDRAVFSAPLQHFAIDCTADGALQELLDLCRRRGIAAVLFVMPEASEFRSLYSQASTALIDGYLADLCHVHGVALVDARTWLGDECFLDAVHLLPRGARAFSERFGREALGQISPGR